MRCLLWVTLSRTMSPLFQFWSFRGGMALAALAYELPRWSLWVLGHPHGHQLMTQIHPKAARRFFFSKKSNCRKLSSAADQRTYGCFRAFKGAMAQVTWA